MSAELYACAFCSQPCDSGNPYAFAGVAGFLCAECNGDLMRAIGIWAAACLRKQHDRERARARAQRRSDIERAAADQLQRDLSAEALPLATRRAIRKRSAA